MFNDCIGNCLVCGKCTRRSFPILGSFKFSNQTFKPRKGLGIAIDIGTTGIAMALLDILTGNIIASHSFLNPQRIFGADVISRITSANNGNLEKMCFMTRESISLGISTIINSQQISPQQIIDIVLSGNTVMTYILLGLPCSSLGVSPFKPLYKQTDYYDFNSLFNVSGIYCPVRIIPWLSAFVGGDVTSGLLCVMPDKQDPFMLIDLGTNGEMALFNNSELIVTSAAVGSAFEDGELNCTASEVIEKLAHLVRNGYVDETGLLSGDVQSPFSQKKIRELQLAKSAVRSGLEILLMSENINWEELNAVYIAGGIGQAMDIGFATDIGLFPKKLGNKAYAVGNASLGGGVRSLLTPEDVASDTKKLLSYAKEINLAEYPLFSEYFMKYINFGN